MLAFTHVLKPIARERDLCQVTDFHSGLKQIWTVLLSTPWTHGARRRPAAILQRLSSAANGLRITRGLAEVVRKLDVDTVVSNKASMCFFTSKSTGKFWYGEFFTKA